MEDLRSIPSTASTSQEDHESNSGSTSSRKLNVTLLSSEWRSTKGSLSTLNRELAIWLAKHPSVEVSVYLPQCSEQDKQVAASHNVHLIEAEEQPGFDPVDCLSFLPKDHAVDCVIGHGAILGRQVQGIKRECSRCKWIQVVHTVPEELGMYRNERTHQVEIELCKLADQVVAVGPKVADAFLGYLRSCEKHQDVLNLTPGIFSEFADVKQASQENNSFSVLVVGGGDSEDFQLKGHDIAAQAIKELKDKTYKLVFAGATSGEKEKVGDLLLQQGIDRLQLRVRCFNGSREKLADLLCEVDLAIMPSQTEGFGLAALEALSAGLPVLVSENSGLGEALKKVPCASICVVQSEEPKDWANAIKAVRVKDRQLRLQEIKIIREQYAKMYTWQDHCNRLVKRMLAISQGPNEDEQHLSKEAFVIGQDEKPSSSEKRLHKGDAEWVALSEQERQRRLVKPELKEELMDVLQRFLGEGFEMEANLGKLMGENKARHLAQLCSRRKAKEEETEDKLVTDGDVGVLQEAVVKALEHKHPDERQALLEVLQQDQPEFTEAASTSTLQQPESLLQQISSKINSLDPGDKEARRNLLVQAAVFKIVNRQKYLDTFQDGVVEKDDVIDSLLADLQQEQDQESEKLVNDLHDKDKTELVQLQENLFQSQKEGLHENVATVLTQAEVWDTANERDLSQALQYEHEALNSSMLFDALIQQVCVIEWAALSNNDRFIKLAHMKLKVQELQGEGKQGELQQILIDSMVLDLISLMEEQGLPDEEIAKLEAEEDVQAEKAAREASTGNALQDLENRLAAEKEPLISDIRGADVKFESEQQRQAQRARMRREERQAFQGSGFQSSSLVLGMFQAREIHLDTISKQDQNRQKQLAQQGLVTWQQKDQSELRKVKEPLNTLETEANPPPVSSASIGALQSLTDLVAKAEAYQQSLSAARDLIEQERKTRLEEIAEDRKAWRMDAVRDAMPVVPDDLQTEAMADDAERQRQKTRQKPEERRKKREEQQYEEDMAASIATVAEKQFAFKREKNMLKRAGAKYTGGFAMKREKTVIDVEVSEEKQLQMVQSLFHEHTNVGMKFERERTRQEEMIRARKEKKKTKIEQKQEVVASILGLGERQKTFVEQQKKEERERQITMVRERIARVRYERTMTMREPKDEKAQGFESLLTEEEKEGLSEEEKMKRIAAKMEERFKSETRRVSTVALAPPGQSLSTSSAEASDEDAAQVERSSHVLDEKSREKKLKERMASRKRERRKSVSPRPEEDDGATGGGD